MTSENARRVLKSMHYVLKGDEAFSIQTQETALEEGMLALEVVEKIKTIINNWAIDDDEHELLEQIADIIEEAE